MTSYSVIASAALPVIASGAKQSILPRKERMDCFAALAMTGSAALAMTGSAPLAMTGSAALAMTEDCFVAEFIIGRAEGAPRSDGA